MSGFYTIAIGAVAGFLTRPCCVIPAAMSIAGVGSAGLAQAVAAYPYPFLAASAVMLGCSMWLTFRRPGGWFLKTLSASATLIAFYFSRGVF